MTEPRQDARNDNDTSADSAAPQTARDREMGRDGKPLGDLGEKGKTWTPPAGEQGFSNRADDQKE